MARSYWFIFAVLGVGLILLIVNDSAGRTFGIDNDAFARSLYLGVLGLVLAAGIVGGARRGRLGSLARNLAAWLLVLLVLVAGYQYRYELQDVASRVTAGLVPGSPLSLRDGDGGETVVLEKFPTAISRRGRPLTARRSGSSSIPGRRLPC